MPHGRLAGDKRLDDDILDLFLKFLNFWWTFFRSFFSGDLGIYLLETLLMAFTCALSVLVWNVLLTFFVYCIICEMHVNISHIARFWWLVWFGGKTSEPFVKKVNSHWINSIEQDIDSEIELKTPQKIGRIDVMLSYDVVMSINVFPLPSQKDSFSLAFAFRFDNEYLLFLLHTLLIWWFLILFHFFLLLAFSGIRLVTLIICLLLCFLLSTLAFRGLLVLLLISIAFLWLTELVFKQVHFLW